MTSNEDRIEVVDALRGLAALAVTWFHFSGSQGLNDELIRLSGMYGWLGVDVFFVISGFVIPYALSRSKYELKHYGYFLIKRIIRLDPPYFAAIAIIIGLGYLAPLIPGFQGNPFQLSIAQLLLHFGYVNVFFGYPWLNIVFWSLAIEFQYYLLIGLIIPFLRKDYGRLRIVLLIAVIAAAFLVPSEQFVFHYSFLFLTGYVTFQYRAGAVTTRGFLALLALAVCGVYLTLGFIVALVSLLTALAIAFVKTKWRRLKFFGDISYSLYLLHVPVGAKVINLGLRFVEHRSGKLCVLAIALAITIGASYLLYRLVEQPAQRLASAFRFRKQDDAQANEKLIDQPAL